MLGNIPRIPGVLPTLAPRTAYAVPAAESRLMAYSDIEVWMQPDLGNARKVGDLLTVAGRKGRVAISTVPAIALGTGMAGALETINIPASGTVAGKQPLHVPDYEITGDYFMAMVCRFDAAAAMGSTVYRFFSAGIDGGADVELYTQNGALYQRHVAASNASATGKFVAGASYLVWATYDATLNKAALGVNTMDPLPLASENLTGAAGAGRPLVIGGKFTAAGSGAEQMFQGQIRAAFVGRTAWYAPSKQLIRRRFLSEVASLYGGDFGLVG